MKKIIFALLLIATLVGFKQKNKLPKKPEKAFKMDGKKAVVFSTADKTNLRLTQTETLQFETAKQPVEREVFVFVDPQQTFQTFVGIGGAITDAAAETFAKLPKQMQQQVLNDYYDAKVGIGYTLARTNMNSCDFSSDMYTYVVEKDSSLSSFNLKHDQQFKIPLIKAAMAATGGKLNLFVSPWSPPSWMKSNNDMLHGGKLLKQYQQSWANYYVKFIKAYEQENIPVWGLTVQNEPMATQRWESCLYTAEEERDFIKKYLGPTLQKTGLSSKRVIAWDHNRDLLPHRASIIYNDAEASKYVWGMGYHWYETWTGSAMQFENLKRVQESFPTKKLLFTEGCAESFDFDTMYNWKLGEKYGYSIINDLNAGTVGWTDWNILLDEKGGPNHVGNFCFAPIIADTKEGKLYYTNSYYYIGHFSKFIRPTAKRVAATSNRDKLLTTAFLNDNGGLVVVVMNSTNASIAYNLIVANKSIKTNSLPHSINTILIQ